MLSCSNLAIGIDNRVLVRGLDFVAYRGTTTCVLGRNGTGKTLTLQTLARLRDSQGGSIALDGKPLADWPRVEFARQVALLTQDSEDPFPASVLETTLIGRHPHIDFWEWESEHDRTLAREALARVELVGLEARSAATLSGGERRRVALAALLVQDPAVLLLDEPTNHLDPRHQLGILRLLKARATAGGTVIMSLHDAGLAARFADQVLMLFGDGNWLCGPAGEVLTTPNVSRLYQADVEEVAWSGGRTFVTL